MDIVINKISESNKGNLQSEFVVLSILSLLFYFIKFTSNLYINGIGRMFPSLHHRPLLKIAYLAIVISLFLYAIASYSISILLFRIALIALSLLIFNFQNNERWFVDIKKFYKADSIFTNCLGFTSIAVEIIKFCAEIFFITAAKVIFFMIFVAINKNFIKPYAFQYSILYYVSGILFIAFFVLTNSKSIIYISRFKYLFFPAVIRDLYYDKKITKKTTKESILYFIDNIIDISMNIALLYFVFKAVRIDIDNHKGFKIIKKTPAIPDSLKFI